MKVREATIYQCEFCGKVYLSKAWAEKHEYACYKNPKNNTLCFSCEHLIHNQDEIYPYCEKIDSHICSAGEAMYNKYEVECYGAEESKKKCGDNKFQELPF